MVPMAVPFIWTKSSSSNLKILFFRTRLRRVSNVLGGRVVLLVISLTTLATPSSLGIRVYRDLMSAVMMSVVGVEGIVFRW